MALLTHAFIVYTRNQTINKRST